MNDRILKAAEDLISKMDEIHNHPSYIGVFSIALSHGYSYDGPTCREELETLRTLVAQSKYPAWDVDEYYRDGAD